jgi:hypothetical protein
MMAAMVEKMCVMKKRMMNTSRPFWYVCEAEVRWSLVGVVGDRIGAGLQQMLACYEALVAAAG